MDEMTLADFGPGSPYMKCLALGDAKLGKTVFIVLSSLGLLPWQEWGIVDDPAHLHVIAIDQDCMDRIQDMMVRCGIKKEVIAYVTSRMKVYSLKKDVLAVEAQAEPYNHTFYGVLNAVRDRIQAQIKEGETHVVLMSSFTRMCNVMERALFGAPVGISDGKGYGSQDLWTVLKGQFASIQNRYHMEEVRSKDGKFLSGGAHIFWEGHVVKENAPGEKPVNGKPATRDSLMVHGGAKQWPMNTSHNMQIFREQAKWIDPATKKPTRCSLMYVNPQPTLSVLPSGGRGVGEVGEREPDLAAMLHKMGYAVGGWSPDR